MYEFKFYLLSFFKDKHNPSIDGKKEEEEEDKDVSDMNPTQRIHHLERSIGFLKQQHQEVLRCLHEEIEGLKKENKGKY